MVLELCDKEYTVNSNTTGFSDSISTPTWVKGYIATALNHGIINGYPAVNGEIYFNSEATITYAEALTILNKALNVTDVAPASISASVGEYPSWSYQAAVNLVASGVISSNVVSTASSPLTRAEAAQLLLNALELLNSRK